ncbi:MAG: hypothetical protein ACYCW6_17795, partial [Candidatus Xenobia bacterium]
RETVDQKADRIIRGNRITWAHGVAIIAGDHDTHVVRRREGGGRTCTCPWSTERPDAKACSHVLAAALTAPTAAATPGVDIPAAPAAPSAAIRANVARRLAEVAGAARPTVTIERCPECRAATIGNRFCAACGWVRIAEQLAPARPACRECGKAPGEADPCDEPERHGLCGDCRWKACGGERQAPATAAATAAAKPRWNPFEGLD